ncbi:MAG: polysaccharide deacetylase family protein [Helicobacteraceae bacterium]|nr:polysaccharide deacetylase family protein [Helicobacteraceae bacterium]
MRLLILLLVSAAFSFAVETSVPYAGLKAEMEKRWVDAANVYEDAVWNDPYRVDLYLRLADIYAVEKQYEKAADTLRRAIEVAPDRTELYVKLSSVYAVDNKPEKALAAITSAVQLEPDNRAYLMAHAKIANWTKKPKIAAVSLERILQKDPDDKEARLLLAKSQEWAKELDDAIAEYKQYLVKNPNDLNVRLALAQLQYIVDDIKGANETLTTGFKAVFKEENVIKLQQNNDINQEVPILLYHCIGETAQNSYWIEKDEFSAQMQFLRQNGYESISTADLTNGILLPRKPVVITFDDGCQNLYTEAYPILQENGFIAEIYLISDAIAETDTERKESSSAKLGETGQYSVTKYLIWPEVKEMAENGMIFGSHSKSHRMMSELSNEDIAYELMFSKLSIYANTGVKTDAFSYPFGSGNSKRSLHQLLTKYGFDNAVAAEGGLDRLTDMDMLNIPRIEIYGAHPSNDRQSQGVSVTLDATRPADQFSAKLNPSAAERLFQKSNRLTAAGALNKALATIDEAVLLEPNNIRYLNTRLHAAGAAKNVNKTVDSAERIYVLDPDNATNILELARSMVWENDLDGAARYYAYYYEKHPADQEIYIEYAQVEMWRGDYASSLEILEQYKTEFGSDDQYTITKADALAWGNRPSQSFELLAPILQKEPQDYKANNINTVALYKHREPIAAVASLEKVEKIAPDSNENSFLRKFVTTESRTSVTGGLEYRYDSDKVSIASAVLGGKYYLTPATNLYADWRTDHLRVSGEYNPEPFGTEATHNTLHAGVAHRFSSLLMASAYVGASSAEEHTDAALGVTLSLVPLDELAFFLSYDHRYFVVTPKTVDLGLKDDALRAGMHWEQSLLWYADVGIGYDAISDDNSRWNVDLSEKRVMLRSQYWGIDAGVSAFLYGYADQSLGEDDGYYAPESYQGYYLTGSFNRALSGNDSLNLLVNGGFFKDNNMDNFELGGSLYLEGVFGIYRDWMFRASAGVDYSGRYYDTSYRGASVQMYVTKRF